MGRLDQVVHVPVGGEDEGEGGRERGRRRGERRRGERGELGLEREVVPAPRVDAEGGRRGQRGRRGRVEAV